MDREELMTILPHRDGMLLLDRVEREEDVAHGFFRIPEDAWFLKGHFPGNPIVPGVMLCEILAQIDQLVAAEERFEAFNVLFFPDERGFCQFVWCNRLKPDFRVLLQRDRPVNIRI